MLGSSISPEPSSKCVRRDRGARVAGIVVALLCAVATRCGGDDTSTGAGGTAGVATSGTGGAPPDSGAGGSLDGGFEGGVVSGGQGKPGFDLVAGGTVMHAPLFTLIVSLGESPGGNGYLGDDHKTMHSALYTLQTGLIPASQKK